MNAHFAIAIVVAGLATSGAQAQCLPTEIDRLLSVSQSEAAGTMTADEASRRIAATVSLDCRRTVAAATKPEITTTVSVEPAACTGAECLVAAPTPTSE